MTTLPNAEVSPRITGGLLKWYYLDTFDLQLKLTLTDHKGLPIIIQPDDTVTVTFYNSNRNVVKQFVFTNIVDNTIALSFNDETSSLFPRGSYTYNVHYRGKQRTTIVYNNGVVVT